jgi:hypothetical protein
MFLSKFNLEGGGGGISLLGILKDMQKVLWRWASLSIGAPLGNLKGSSFTRDFERWITGALEVERLSLRELC